MADETKDTSDEKPEPKVPGKYKTLEEAEKAVKESETRMHAATTEAAQLRKDLSRALETRETPRVDAPSKATDDADETALAQALLTNPRKILGDLARVVREDTLAQAHASTMAYVETRLTIKDFVDKHPLANKHRELFKTTLTDAKGDTLEARLGAAHEALETILEQARSEGKKDAAAERKARQKAAMVSDTDDEGAAPDRSERDEEVVEDTPESYMKEREDSFAKLKVAQ